MPIIDNDGEIKSYHRATTQHVNLKYSNYDLWSGIIEFLILGAILWFDYFVHFFIEKHQEALHLQRHLQQASQPRILVSSINYLRMDVVNNGTTDSGWRLNNCEGGSN